MAVGKSFPYREPTFSDRGSFSSWAYDEIGMVQAAGVMGGVGNNRFDPKGTYTREQSIATTLRTYNYFQNTTPTAPEPTIAGKYINRDAGDSSPGYEPYLELRNNGTFKFAENYYEGMEVIEGTYIHDRGYVYCNVPQGNPFFDYYNITDLIFEVRGSELIYASHSMSMTKWGDAFRR